MYLSETHEKKCALNEEHPDLPEINTLTDGSLHQLS